MNVDADTRKLEQLLAQIRVEFPSFRLVRKDRSRFQKVIHYALIALTFGRMRRYLEGYQTTIRRTVYVTPDWDSRPALDRYVVMRHELIHLRQFRKFTLPGMAFLYLLIPLPMGLAYFRARFEKQAYAETIRASIEVFGPESVSDVYFRNNILAQFTGPTYGWMWPFRGHLERWYDSVVQACLSESQA